MTPLHMSLNLVSIPADNDAGGNDADRPLSRMLNVGLIPEIFRTCSVHI